MESSTRRVLILDDNPGRHGLLPQTANTVFTVRHPLDLEPSELEGIDLVCVDEYLGEEWVLEVTNRVSGLPTLMNNDGLAVAAALRSRARLSAQDGGPGFAVALFTAELDKLAHGTPTSRQEPLTASLHDLEWVFRFEDGPAPLADRISELAAAAKSVANIDVAASADQLLGLRDQAWADLARAQIDDCRPPEHAMARSTSGRSYLRWLTQRILPYPAFLLDETYSANLLGITLDAFQSPEFQAFLDQHEAGYSGALSCSFLGPRWWRAALQQLLVDVGATQWDTPSEKAKLLSTASSSDLEALQADSPVITYDTAGSVARIDAEAADSVRVQMDGWPVYADEAWAELTDVRADPSLRALVAHDDLPRLES